MSQQHYSYIPRTVISVAEVFNHRDVSSVVKFSESCRILVFIFVIIYSIPILLVHFYTYIQYDHLVIGFPDLRGIPISLAYRGQNSNLKHPKLNVLNGNEVKLPACLTKYDTMQKLVKWKYNCTRS